MLIIILFLLIFFLHSLFLVPRRKEKMTKLGLFLAQRMTNRSELARKAGIERNRLSNICDRDSARITGEEVHLLALALNMEPNELHQILFDHVKLPE